MAANSYNGDFPKPNKRDVLRNCYYWLLQPHHEIYGIQEVLVHLNLSPSQIITSELEESVDWIMNKVEAHNSVLRLESQAQEALKREHIAKELERLRAEGLY